MQFISKNLQGTEQFARDFLSKLKPNKSEATVLALHGDLGSGKTAFTKCLAKILGVKNEITSPTFVIEKKYPIKNHPSFKQLIHIDSYRLKGGEELVKLDWNEIVSDKNNLIVVEWPELVADIIPPTANRLDFEFIDETTRKITTNV